MYACKPLNFQRVSIYHGQEKPYGYMISVGSLAQMYVCTYDPDEGSLSITDMAYSSDWVIKFKVDSIEEASQLVKKFADGMEVDMSETIYMDEPSEDLVQ